MAFQVNEEPFIADYSELYAKKLALQAHYFITEYVREHHPQIEITEVENTRKALKIVSGHKKGNEVLETIAEITRKLIRRNDHLERWGGEEFLIILPDTTLIGCGRLAEKLRRAIEAHDFGLEAPVTASFGYGQYESGEKIDAFLSRIVESLYRAKGQDRNTVIHAELVN